MSTVSTLPSLECLATSIRAAHRSCAASFTQGLKHALECGRLLILAKRRVNHGGWGIWLNEHCQIPERLAQKYMRVARELPKLQERDPANTPRVADLSFRRALELIAENAETTRNLPAPERRSVLDRADEQENPSVREAARELRVEARERRRLDELQAERQRRETLRQQPYHDELAIEKPFLPSELGPPLPEPPIQFNAEGGFRAAVPGLNADELEALRLHVGEHQRWYASLAEYLRNCLGRHHGATSLADTLEEELVSLLEALEAI